jgi:hypothetical protein
MIGNLSLLRDKPAQSRQVLPTLTAHAPRNHHVCGFFDPGHDSHLDKYGDLSETIKPHFGTVQQLLVNQQIALRRVVYGAHVIGGQSSNPKFALGAVKYRPAMLKQVLICVSTQFPL